MFNDVNGFPDHEIEERDLVEGLSWNDVGGELICDADDDGEYKDWKGNVIETTKAVWRTPITTFSSVKASYVHYGDEACIEYSHGGCLSCSAGSLFG